MVTEFWSNFLPISELLVETLLGVTVYDTIVQFGA